MPVRPCTVARGELKAVRHKEWGATFLAQGESGEQRWFCVQDNRPEVLEDLNRLSPGAEIEFMFRPGPVKKGGYRLFYVEAIIAGDGNRT